MSTRTYPYDAWVLKPSFKPVKVTLVKPYVSFNGQDYGDVVDSGMNYRLSELFPTIHEAIAAGRYRLFNEEAKAIDKLDSIKKRRAVLDKAEQS